jgi:hypothetical protein
MSRDRRKSFKQGNSLHVVGKSRPLRAVTSQQTGHLEQTDGFQLSSERYSLLTYSLAESWNNHFMPFTMNHLKSVFCIASGVFDSITRMISNAEEGSALYQACNAVGCAHLAKQTQFSKAIYDRARAYGAALTAVNLAIRDPQQCKSEKTLLGVWLLGRYEVRYKIQILLSTSVTNTLAIQLLLDPPDVSPLGSHLLDGTFTAEH